MRICVYGAGAVGGLMAAWLARSGQDVSVVARGARLQAIQHHGLRVRSKGEVESFRIKSEADPAKLGTQDYVLVTVKAQSLTHVAESISPLLDKDTSVVTAMNGVPWWFFDRLKFGNGRERLESLDPGGKLSRAMPTGRIVGCVIHLAASTPEPGLISHNMGSRLILGEPGGRNTARTTRIAEALAAAGFEAVVSEPGHMRLAFHDLSGVGYHRFDCDYTIGLLRTVPRLFGFPPARDWRNGFALHLTADPANPWTAWFPAWFGRGLEPMVSMAACMMRSSIRFTCAV